MPIHGAAPVNSGKEETACYTFALALRGFLGTALALAARPAGGWNSG